MQIEIIFSICTTFFHEKKEFLFKIFLKCDFISLSYLMIFLPQCIKSYDIVYSNYIKISYYTASGLLQIRKLDLNMCTNLCLLKYFAFFSSTEAVIDMIFVDLGFSQKDLHLLFWGINSYGHTYCTISINLARG